MTKHYISTETEKYIDINLFCKEKGAIIDTLRIEKNSPHILVKSAEQYALKGNLEKAWQVLKNEIKYSQNEIEQYFFKYFGDFSTFDYVIKKKLAVSQMSYIQFAEISTWIDDYYKNTENKTAFINSFYEFLSNLAIAPLRTKQNIFKLLKAGLKIDHCGYIVALKIVRKKKDDSLTDMYSGKLDYTVGSIHEVKEYDTAHNAGSGLHFSNKEYILPYLKNNNSYYDSVVPVVVKIHPKDVVFSDDFCNFDYKYKCKKYEIYAIAKALNIWEDKFAIFDRVSNGAHCCIHPSDIEMYLNPIKQYEKNVKKFSTRKNTLLYEDGYTDALNLSKNIMEAINNNDTDYFEGFKAAFDKKCLQHIE